MSTEKLKAGPEGESIVIPISSIHANMKNSRSTVDKTSNEYKELALDIRKTGLLEDIVIAEIEGKYEVVAGFRRWTACQAQSFVYDKNYYELDAVSPLRCKLRKVTTQSDFILINLGENLHREDLKPYEIAKSIWDLEDSFRAERKRYTADDIAKAISRSKSYAVSLSNTRKLIKEWKEAWFSNLIPTDRAIEISYKADIEQRTMYNAFIEAKNSPDLAEDEKTKKKKQGKEPKVMKREKIEKFWMDICRCTKNEGNIKISGKYQPCTEEVRQIARTIIRTITGEMQYPLKDIGADEDFENMDD